MKRARFIGASAAALLAGCGGNHVMRALPGGQSITGMPAAPTGAVRLIPDAADAIPATVLSSPIIGEFRRFDGKTAPANWVLAQGQAMTAAGNPQLFSLLGKLTGDGRGTFTLPNPGFGAIIAIAGMFPTSPAMLASARRRTTADSLGPGAIPSTGRHLSQKVQAARQQRDVEIAAARRASASAVRVRTGSVMRVSPEFQARVETDREQSRTAALGSLSASNRARTEAFVGAILERRTSHADAVRQMAASLSGAEANALLSVFDATQRAFRPGWSGMEHPDPQNEAARYLMAIAFDREQLSRLRAMPDLN